MTANVFFHPFNSSPLEVVNKEGTTKIGLKIVELPTKKFTIQANLCNAEFRAPTNLRSRQVGARKKKTIWIPSLVFRKIQFLHHDSSVSPLHPGDFLSTRKIFVLLQRVHGEGILSLNPNSGTLDIRLTYIE